MDATNESALVLLTQRLSSFNYVDLLAGVGAPQLIPENADRSVRLEVLAHTIVPMTPNNVTEQISTNLLNTICNSWPLVDSPIAAAEPSIAVSANTKSGTVSCLPAHVLRKI